MNRVSLLLIFGGLLSSVVHGQDRDARIADLDKKLTEAREAASTLQRTIETLATELTSLRQSDKTIVAPSAPPPEPIVETHSAPKEHAFKNKILGVDLGGDERDKNLAGRPELFIQSRFQAFPLRGTDLSSAPSNFVLTRMESRWAGRISNKIGLGFELQYHPAPMGAAVEIVNDAFVEYYASKQITIRAGQFVKPFGFAIQQSSSVREAPERGIFAGYFFPGQRDRGVLIAVKLDELGSAWKGAQVSAGVLNGNRFFVDNNRQLNYNLRFRKIFSSVPLAVGASVQLGKQLLPPGVNGSTNENLYGADVQWSWKRVGVRAEVAGGNMPSTLLGLTPEFAPLFRPGAHAVGGTALISFRVVGRDQVYWRYDQFNRDLVSGENIRAFDIGYFHYIGENSRLGVDYQFKNKISNNDDRLNTRLQIIWNVMY